MKGYNLVLQHCQADLEAELEAKLKNQDAWGEVEDTRSVVRLLTLIRDLQYKKTDRKRSIMTTVEADFELFAGCQKKNQSTDAYYKVFTSTVDTINANRGGWHDGIPSSSRYTEMPLWRCKKWQSRRWTARRRRKSESESRRRRASRRALSILLASSCCW